MPLSEDDERTLEVLIREEESGKVIKHRKWAKVYDLPLKKILKKP